MQSWDLFLQELDKELGKPTVDKWLRSLKVLRFDACNLYLQARDSFQIIWFEEHVRQRCRRHLLNNNRHRVEVHLSVNNARGKQTPLNTKGACKHGELPQHFKLHFAEWDPHFHFANFVQSETNTLAYRVLEGCRENLDFNPIYLWGSAGTGKTHLLTATARALAELGWRVRFAHSDAFTEHVVQAIRAGEMHRFRQAYRDVDALIIDDIQVFSKKRATQEEFFHTFNALHVENKVIIIAADRPPQELVSVEPRLISRFEWGVVLPLSDPDRHTVGQILEKKEKELGVPLSSKVREYLLRTFEYRVANVIRALEALLLRAHMEARKLTGLTVSDAEVMLRDLVQRSHLERHTPEQIIAQVAAFYGVGVEAILSKSQSREYVVPRKIAMHLCRNMLRLSFTKIGSIFERDHSTVMSSCKSIARMLEDKQSEVAAPIQAICQSLREAQ